MSRIGESPIDVPDKVTVELRDGNTVAVEGPLGQLQQQIRPEITVEIDDDTIVVTRSNDANEVRALHGLSRALIANMVQGVTEGFEKRLELHGVGYRADMQGSNMRLRVGYSEDVIIEPPEGIELSVEDDEIIVRGCDKQQVGQIAADIRGVRPVEPYKGKGIRYVGEHVRRKAGKAAKVGTEGIGVGA